MIIIMKPDATSSNIERVANYITDNGLQVHLSKGTEVTIIGIVGDKSRLSTENISIFEGVDRIVPVTESYNTVNTFENGNVLTVLYLLPKATNFPIVNFIRNRPL